MTEKVIQSDTGEMLTFYNYKEPLKPVPKKEGHGFFGVVLGSVDGKKIQCHICGELWASVGVHAYNTHGLKASEYKEKFSLARGTSLVSEETRFLQKMNMIKRFNKMTEQEKEELKESTAHGIWMAHKALKKGRSKIRLETKNKRGTCPDQLLEKIRVCAEKIGRSPSIHDFNGHYGSARYEKLILKTFGSWNKAKEMAGLDTYAVREISEDRKNRKYIRYSPEELIEYLQLFYKEEGKIPAESDCRRGLLPSRSAFITHFGSMRNARQVANIPEPRQGGSLVKGLLRWGVK